MKLTFNINSTEIPGTTDDLLQQLSDERARQLLPVFIILTIVFVVGVVGNSLTVYIYWFKFKATRSRAAIMTLAVFDLITCLVAVPGEAIDLRFSFNYGSDGMCRILRTCAVFPSIASGLILTTVAFDRYRLICTPHRSSSAVTRKTVRMNIIAVCAVSLLITWPSAVIYGITTTRTGIDGVMGQECSTSDGVRHTKFPLVYNSFLGLVFVTAFAVIIVCYSLVGRQVYRQGNFRKSFMHSRELNPKNSRGELEALSFATSDPPPADVGQPVASQGDNSSRRRVSSSVHFRDSAVKLSAQLAENVSELPSSNLVEDDQTDLRSDTVQSHSGEEQTSSPHEVQPSTEVNVNPSAEMECLPNKKQNIFDGRSSDIHILDDVDKRSQDKDTCANYDSSLKDKDIESEFTQNQIYGEDESTHQATEKELCSKDAGSHNLDEEKPQTKLSLMLPPRPRASLARNGCRDDLSTFSLSPLPSSPASKDRQDAFTSRRKLSRTPSVLQRLQARKKSSNVSITSSNSWRTGKTTMTLWLISLVFVLSYVPHLAARIRRAVDKDWLGEHDVSSSALIAYSLCIRSYFLNSFANVFVYGVCSKNFRQQCGKVVSALGSCRR